MDLKHAGCSCSRLSEDRQKVSHQKEMQLSSRVKIASLFCSAKKQWKPAGDNQIRAVSTGTYWCKI